jgi:hypothetical protein
MTRSSAEESASVSIFPQNVQESVQLAMRGESRHRLSTRRRCARNKIHPIAHAVVSQALTKLQIEVIFFIRSGDTPRSSGSSGSVADWPKCKRNGSWNEDTQLLMGRPASYEELDAGFEPILCPRRLTRKSEAYSHHRGLVPAGKNLRAGSFTARVLIRFHSNFGLSKRTFSLAKRI